MLAEKISQLWHSFASDQFMAHGHCYLWQPPLVWTMVITDTLIGLAYLSISISLYSLVRRIKLPFTPMFLAFGLFIGACGMTHFMEVYNLWVPNYWLAALLKVVTAAASVATAALMFPVQPRIAAFSETAKLSEDRRDRLESLTNELEQKVSDRTADLRQAVEARDEFLSIASHELRTPMTPVLMQLQMTQRDVSRAPRQSGKILLDEARLTKSLDMSFRQITQLSSLVDNLLDVSRIESGKLDLLLEPEDLGALIKSVADRFATQYRAAGSEIITQGFDQKILCNCDRVRIEQVITNLLSNALKYGGGKPVTLVLAKVGYDAIVRIEDQGVGIKPDKIGKIFDRFERATDDRNISGMGLGLYICHQIMTAHGGHIDVQSDNGTIFTMRLRIIG